MLWTTTFRQDTQAIGLFYKKWDSEISSSITVHLDGLHDRLQGHSEYLGVQLDPSNLNAVTLQ